MAVAQPSSSVQVGMGVRNVEFFDIMTIGTTGQGKSTTGDKLLIANPTGHDYTAGAQKVSSSTPPSHTEVQVDEENHQLKLSDITMWLTHGTEGEKEFETHLKFLNNCRTKAKPHEEVNKARSAAMKIFKPTKDCEVVSNDTSRVRIMNVPGFFDRAQILRRQTDSQNGSLLSPTKKLELSNLGIMRTIIRIQTTLAMNFNRILYFLPSRGPLERMNAVLMLELEWMAHYFGRAIFKSMVLVATVQPRFSQMEIDNNEKFTNKDAQMTKEFFHKALDEVFSPSPENPIPDPPLIFISLTDTCEEILAKVKGANVEQEGLCLEFDPDMCADCGVRIGVIQGQRVTCYFGEDAFKDAIPYEDSTCHPLIVPKYTPAQVLWEHFKHVVLFRFITRPWPLLTDEICSLCGNVPNTRGCRKVGTECTINGQTVTVDHSNQIESPSRDVQ